MDDDGGLGIRNWGYYDPQPQIKGNLGLQLMSSVPPDRDTKPFLPNNSFTSFLNRLQEPSHAAMSFMRPDMWAQNHHTHVNRENVANKMLRSMPMANTHHHTHHTNFSPITQNAIHMLPHQPPVPPPPPPPSVPELPKHEQIVPRQEHIVPMVPEPSPKVSTPIKKRAQTQNGPPKNPKPKKPKKTNESSTGRAPRGTRKDTGVVINGIDVDLSRIPTPVCSCTGSPQQCYRWGIGGWQSACCTTSISVYPLPMSTKRRGARIAGRKMSQGAFKKVLEKLAGEGYNLSNPIDLRGFWAKHGTNKFVTIK
ncbi:BASIC PENTACYSTEINE protein [Rhynchospora pubera]|uniref:GAGA-binding transcriptional activator n=1 Tax=Rhynchospora pubera TaxID=906938 RepID=A0AAV8HQX3_9POAL|nr:BASIC PENTACYSTEINE protein [Rhynchospora pubera]KAJ4819994.1 BASIC PENTACYSTEINE protein [Rhynchospora pubera]